MNLKVLKLLNKNKLKKFNMRINENFYKYNIVKILKYLINIFFIKYLKIYFERKDKNIV